MKKALITGITGQDGSYLAEFLLARGYQVHGLVRRSSAFGTGRIEHIYLDEHLPTDGLQLHYGDLNDASSLQRVLARVAPDEIYNLGAQSHVRISFDIPEYTVEVAGVGTLRLLEAIRNLGMTPRFYQASSSEMFGKVAEVPQTERTPFHPRSPYACAKVFAHQITVNYRESYGLHASCGILFNHESPRRGENFVTRKICRAAAAISAGKQRELLLGDTSARRDWGHAKDYVRGMWLALQHATPEDYIFATGQTHTVQEVVEIAFAAVGLDWKEYVKRDPRLLRPAESASLVGDPSKAIRLLRWKRDYSFRQIIEELTLAERAALE